MRLTKIKLSGFKSFVDPTTVTFPSNLTGVVGPNGCGKSNVIDAVRWVMGELSAKHLRGESMSDVIFNGSSARKPVGAAAVELVFDNSDGKIGGPFASYNEVSLRRVVSRDGSSSYFINGGRCRRKDITHLFLGTGLGSRSYAIIEQGMISRVIEAKPDDMRAFVEEAAGISRYKERRRETESRIGETRENLERLQDLRDEVEKQIRHLQRQAATARRYQAFKEQERRLTAEALALRLRDLDGGADVHDSAVRERELAMQAALADQRAAEAAIEKQRAFHDEQSGGVSAVQARYYEIGADISRTEQTIQHTRELRERQRADLAQATASAAELREHIERDEQQLSVLRAEIAQLAPALEEHTQREREAAGALEAAEKALEAWQQQWEAFNRALGTADQTVQVERARIEQLENQQRRLTAQADRLALEHGTLAAQGAGVHLASIEERERNARSQAETLANVLKTAFEATQRLRAGQLAVEAQLDAARLQRERVRGEVVALEALQQAALGAPSGRASEWVAAQGLAARPRVAGAIEVEAGWERAVETVLGEYLEAVCVTGLDDLAGALASFTEGRVTLVEHVFAARTTPRPSLAAKVAGPRAVIELLSRVFPADSLAEALAGRARLEPGDSLMTREGEWVGRDWVRVNRGTDPHAGVIEREQRLRTLRADAASSEERVREIEAQLAAVREELASAENERDRAQQGIQAAHREHADLLAQLEASRARSQESTLRREQLEAQAAEVANERAVAQHTLARARAELDRGLQELASLDGRRPELEDDREALREAHAAARGRSQAVQNAARDLLIRIESRRSAESSTSLALQRMLEQRTQYERRCEELARELAGGDAPIAELQSRLEASLTRRLEVEGELSAARRALEEAEAELRALDERRAAAEQRVEGARAAMDEARLAAQETRVRREGIAEQFAATGFELEAVRTSLAPDAAVPDWEARIAETRADLERLGQVNLAAIDELKEQSERKDYLDRQFADLNDALTTLEQAMRRIDKETRARFEETFDRINAGLKDKFPRLFGGGHAYLELVGEDALTAGVGVMARPPGKRNSSISQLSGGEKALTAVALVFAIFDLNPAPFCLLDEVDAPLDEHNVGRFCDIVREMSGRVQFIFITHNKATMELASQLVGVTMNEPGVSRLVSVDVDEAVRLAAV